MCAYLCDRDHFLYSLIDDASKMFMLDEIIPVIACTHKLRSLKWSSPTLILRFVTSINYLINNRA
jgi:hypothetical protein